MLLGRANVAYSRYQATPGRECSAILCVPPVSGSTECCFPETRSFRCGGRDRTKRVGNQHRREQEGGNYDTTIETGKDGDMKQRQPRRRRQQHTRRKNPTLNLKLFKGQP